MVLASQVPATTMACCRAVPPSDYSLVTKRTTRLSSHPSRHLHTSKNAVNSVFTALTSLYNGLRPSESVTKLI